MDADQIIAKLDLAPHPEGGWFRQTWVADAPDGTRSAGTAIYYLLKAGEVSALHRIDSAEVWHYYAGAPLVLQSGVRREGLLQIARLGPNIAANEQPQVIIPPRHWQTAHSTGDWTLAGCTVSPGFQFEHFELA